MMWYVCAYGLLISRCYGSVLRREIHHESRGTNVENNPEESPTDLSHGDLADANDVDVQDPGSPSEDVGVDISAENEKSESSSESRGSGSDSDEPSAFNPEKCEHSQAIENYVGEVLKNLRNPFSLASVKEDSTYFRCLLYYTLIDWEEFCQVIRCDDCGVITDCLACCMCKVLCQ